MKKIIKYILLAVFLITLGYFFTLWVTTRRAAISLKEAAIISNENTAPGEVLGEEGSAPSADASRMFSSQNYRTPQITFGGEAITVPSGNQSIAPEILDMRSELLTTKKDQKVRFLLSWKTNKECRSSIEYKKEGQSEARMVSEDGYGFVHSVEIAPLNYATSYSYAVTATDKWGNEKKSDNLAFYTGAQNVSIFDLIGGAFKDMFGWAGR